jgi:predicted amidophosphoribosyltransferase
MKDPYPLFPPPPCCIQCGRAFRPGEECCLSAAAAVHPACVDRYAEEPHVRAWLRSRVAVAEGASDA